MQLNRGTEKQFSTAQGAVISLYKASFAGVTAGFSRYCGLRPNGLSIGKNIRVIAGPEGGVAMTRILYILPRKIQPVYSGQ